VKITAGDMLAVLIAASTSVALAQTSDFHPAKGAGHHPPRSASFLGHSSHMGQISRSGAVAQSGRPSRTVRLAPAPPGEASRCARSPAPSEPPGQAVAGDGCLMDTKLSEINAVPERPEVAAGGSAESLHTAIQ
jgi:hypothetical protein